jgi:uncharacterized protein YqeY
MIAQALQQKIGEAMKAHDTVRLSVLRLLSSAFNYKKIELQQELGESDEEKVIRKEVKQRRDSIEAYEKANRMDLAESEKAELAILLEFLPPEMSEEELAKIVTEAMDTVKPAGMGDMGKVIGFVKGKAPDADSGKIAQLVKDKLANF